jgi:16S rRNA (cytosine1402-N4)-methyltransferase
MAALHVPVLAGELIDLVDPQPGETIVDCTFGAGGHARLLAERIGSSGTLIAIDRDPAAEDRFAELAADVPCHARFVHAAFAEGLAMLAEEGLRPDAIVFDLGVSSMQVDTRERGFSYAYEAPLDMRMDPGEGLTAQEIVGEWDERRLAGLFREYGEERYAGSIARAIVRRRELAPLRTTAELVETIKSGMPAPARFAAGHPAKRVFQAIRIAVNGELDQLDEALPTAFDMLATGGRLAAISFHSLEDRRVKRFLAGLATGCVCPPEIPVCVCGHEPEAELITRRAVKPSEDEIERNPRSRSARLRVARRIGDAGSPRSEGENARR